MYDIVVLIGNMVLFFFTKLHRNACTIGAYYTQGCNYSLLLASVTRGCIIFSFRNAVPYDIQGCNLYHVFSFRITESYYTQSM